MIEIKLEFLVADYQIIRCDFICMAFSNVVVTGQWAPHNLDRKKVYDKEFLLSLRNSPASRKKPDNLPDGVAVKFLIVKLNAYVTCVRIFCRDLVMGDIPWEVELILQIHLFQITWVNLVRKEA